MRIKLLEHLKNSLQDKLPGWEAQKLMTSQGYEENRMPQPKSKSAAVLALLYPDPSGDLNLVYIKRPSNNPHDKHGGQISFPGGQREKEDLTLEITALRETEEEIGIPRDKIQILGALSSIYVFVSDFNVQPYIGFTETPPLFKIQESEVDFPITIPIAHLLDKANQGVKDIKVRNYTIKKAPYYDLKGETLWGATAMITSEILELIKSG